MTYVPELGCWFFLDNALSLTIARLQQFFTSFVLKSSFWSLLQSCFALSITEMCEDFFCSRCKGGWVLQYKGGTKCLSNCPYGFYRKQDWYSDQSTVTVSSKLFSFSSVRVVAVIRELKQERF